jgi:hypothetical protein
MAQRLMIARALMHEPELLFLDEPATGLDPQSRLFVHERIAALDARSVTIVITTHDMHEAEKLCERIAIMDHGRIIAVDRTDELRKLVPAGTALELEVAFRGSADGALDGLLDALGRLPGVERVERVAPAQRSFGPPPGLPPQALAFMSAGPPPGVPAGPPRVRVYGGGGTELVPAALAAAADAGLAAGLALRPGTPLDAVLPWLDRVDLVLPMTVEPGFGGQRFLADQLPKIRAARQAIDAAGRPVALQVDGEYLGRVERSSIGFEPDAVRVLVPPARTPARRAASL